MLASIAPYLTAFVAMCFAATSAFTLVRWVNRFDPPSIDGPADKKEQAAAA